VSRGQVAALLVLAVLAALFVVATVAGTRQPNGSGLRGGPVALLGSVLVQPGRLSDVRPRDPACVLGGRLVVPAKRPCEYDLASGFLAKRLRLRLTGSGILTAQLVQPNPQATDVKTLDGGHPTADLTYRESGSRLTLTCATVGDAPCVAEVAP
jgi:hypothetical protein